MNGGPSFEQMKKETDKASEEKELPGVSCDGVFQYNQPLSWFKMSTHDLVKRFLNVIGLDMFFPKSFEYELTAYIINALDYTATHPDSSVKRFSTGRITRLAVDKQLTLDPDFSQKLDYVCAQWDSARASWVEALRRLQHLMTWDENEKENGENGENGENEGSKEELFRQCCSSVCLTFSDMLINVVLAALYITYVSRLHLCDYIHDNHVLLCLEELFRENADNGTETTKEEARQDQDQRIRAWFEGFKRKLFDSRLISPRNIFQIGGKLKNSQFVHDYFATDDDKARAEIVNKNGALTHEDYHLGDFLMDVIFFLWKQYQTNFIDDETTSQIFEGCADETYANVEFPSWLPREICIGLCARVHYFKAPFEDTNVKNENVTNEKNIISFLNQINKAV